jgi:hypothetical protein
MTAKKQDARLTLYGIIQSRQRLVPESVTPSCKRCGGTGEYQQKPRFERATELESPKPGFTRQEGKRLHRAETSRVSFG